MLLTHGASAAPLPPVALTVGNFDGIHRGHQAMLQRLLAGARSRGLQACVLTFEPHPREFFSPQAAPTRLTSLREKLELLARTAWRAPTFSASTARSRRWRRRLSSSRSWRSGSRRGGS